MSIREHELAKKALKMMEKGEDGCGSLESAIATLCPDEEIGVFHRVQNWAFVIQDIKARDKSVTRQETPGEQIRFERSAPSYLARADIFG